ncbi:hypothetical protein [Halomonas korlensis]|nr:hypothetical protein [Halomonas korlensis]
MTCYLSFFRQRLDSLLRDGCLAMLCLVALPASAAIDVIEVPGEFNLGP